jgi:hypothetical protein
MQQHRPGLAAGLDRCGHGIRRACEHAGDSRSDDRAPTAGQELPSPDIEPD